MTQPPKKFVGLHAHTMSSVFDGFGNPEEHIDFAFNNGSDAMAFTEHGNMNSVPFSYTKAKEMAKEGKSFKYIPGVEAYYHPDLNEWTATKERLEAEKADKKKGAKGTSEILDTLDEETGGAENEDDTKSSKKYQNPLNRRHHLVILPKTNKGLENLFRLVSKSYKDGFYRFPRIDRAMLKEFGEDLIISSACVGGVLSSDVFQEFPDAQFDDLTWDKLDQTGARERIMTRMENTLDQLSDAVGRDNVFAELQFNKLNAQNLSNRAILELHNRTGVQLLSTADSHYTSPEMWLPREIYKKLGRLNYDEISPDLLPKDKSSLKCELYPKNAEQMWAAYKDYCSDLPFYNDEKIAASIENSWHIAHDVIGKITLDNSLKLPSFMIPQGMTDFAFLVEECKKGMRSRGLSGKQEYIDRLKMELAVIRKKNFSKYFLTMKAIIDVAEKCMLIGAGRGSGPGSLVNYVLGITDLDPLKYGLYFERFLNETRCLNKSTLVSTKSGAKKIEDLSIGEIIEGSSGDAVVLDIAQTEHQTTVQIQIGDEIIECSENHKWEIMRDGVVMTLEAKDILSSDLIRKA
jgi:DNA polymerase III alpha subunit